MADTATYAGAMKTTIPGVFRKVARKRGDARVAGSQGASLPPKVAHSAAVMRQGRRQKPKRGARTIPPGPNANGIRPV